MSETIETQQDAGGTPVTVDDLQRMLSEGRAERDNLIRERDSERSGRSQAEQRAEAERAQRLVTESERDGHAQRVVNEAEHRYNAQREAVRNGISVLEGTVSTAEEAYARHAEAGDWSSAAKAQRHMAEAAAKLTNLQAQSEYLENNRERLVPQYQVPPRRDVQVPQQEQRQSGDKYAQFIKGRIEPSEKAWLDQRPKFMDNPAYRNEIFAASQLSTARGYARGSDPYFKEMSKILGEDSGPTNGSGHNGTGREPVRYDRNLSSDLAPQRRSAPGAQPSGGGREIKLTADECEVADALYGNQNNEDYLPNRAERYERYDTMKRRRAESGRT
jgi:hypothetical protein